MTQQLNNFKLGNEWDLEMLKGEVTAHVTVKLSHTKSKVTDLKAEMFKQAEAAKDTSDTLQDLLVSITNLMGNVSKMQEERIFWRYSDTMEAEEELATL